MRKRKLAVYGASALLVLSSAIGVTYAQDATATPAPSTVTVTARTWLGVSVTDDGTGVTIARVSRNSPASAAGLQAGDVILSVNGTTVDTAADLQAIIEAAASGDVVTLSIQRGSDTLSVDATLATSNGPMGPGGFGGALALPTDPVQAAELVLHAQLEAGDGGYKVDSVDNNNPFSLLAGDVITEINGTAIASVDWATLFAPPTTNSTDNTANTVTLTVTRDGASTTLQGDFRFFGRAFGQRGGRGNGGPGGFSNDGEDDHGFGGFPDDGGQLQLPGNGNNNNLPSLPPLSGNNNTQPNQPNPPSSTQQPSGGAI